VRDALLGAAAAFTDGAAGPDDDTTLVVLSWHGPARAAEPADTPFVNRPAFAEAAPARA
jgi:hypothetical protein